MQPVLRRRAGARGRAARARLRALRAVGPRLPGPAVRHPRRPDDPLVRGAHDGRERAGSPRLRPRGPRLHRAEAGRHRRAQPRRHARPRVDAAGPRRPPRAAPRHDRQPAPRDRHLLAESRELLGAPVARRLRARLRGLPRVRRRRHAVPHGAEPRRDAGPDPRARAAQRGHELRLLLRRRRRARARPRRGPARPAARLLGQRPRRGAARPERRPRRPGRYDAVLGSAHLGILNSPETWALVGDFLTASNGNVGGPR